MQTWSSGTLAAAGVGMIFLRSKSFIEMGVLNPAVVLALLSASNDV